jgi:glycosyltransferase involved in cell wall biosynthesis
MIFGTIVTMKIGKRYDYVFGFDIGALTGMLPAVILNMFYKKRVILWVQDIWPDSVYAYGFKKSKILEYILNGFVRFIYRYTDAFAITGEGFRDKILPYINNNQPIKYIPNWADEFNRNLEPFSFNSNNIKNFTFAGNIGKLQNLKNVIIGFGELEALYQSKAQLNIIGDGTELNSLKIFVEENNYKNIIFWGRKPKDEMYKYFQASDFLIVSLIDSPILELTVPAKVQTYIASNKPILAILNGDTADMIKDNSLGYCASPNNINEIKGIFKQAINTSDIELEKFTKNCEYLTKTTFNKETIIDNIIKLMEK